MKNALGTPKTTSSGLVSGEGLLKIVWPDPASRPCLRWLRGLQKTKALPFLKVGRRVFFNPEKVRQELERRYTIPPA